MHDSSVLGSWWWWWWNGSLNIHKVTPVTIFSSAFHLRDILNSIQAVGSC